MRDCVRSDLGGGVFKAVSLVAAITLLMGISKPILAQDGNIDLTRVRGLIDDRQEQGVEDAKNMLEKAVKQAPQNAEMQYLMARTLYVLRDYEAAADYAGRAVALAPRNANYHVLLGKATGARARHGGLFKQASFARKAKAEFEAAISADPKHIEARWALMDYLFEAPWIVGGSVKASFLEAQEIAKLDASEGHIALGELYRMQKKNADAEKEYKLGVEADPSKVKAYLRLINFFLIQKRMKDAEPYITKCAELAHQNVTVLYYVARANIFEGKNLDDAEKYLKMYLTRYPEETYPDRAYAHLRLGQVYQKQGKNELAVKSFEEAVRLMPEMDEAREELKNLSRNKS